MPEVTFQICIVIIHNRTDMKLKLKDTDDMQRYFFGPDVDKEKIYTNIHQCIEHGILNDLDDVIFCSIDFLNDEEGFEMICIREDYSKNLDNVLVWYEETNQFEKCKEIMTLKGKL